MAHIPVLLDEVLHYIDPKPGEFVIDGTVNGGGHAKEIISHVSPGGAFLGIDLDPDIIHRHENLCENVESSCRLVIGNYVNAASIIEEEQLPKADGFLLDLGFSSEQIEASGKGFSFLHDEPLRMTYDPKAEPVSKILSKLSSSQLARILKDFGGEHFANHIAKAISLRTKRKPITRTGELADIVRNAVPKGYEHGRIDPATRTFQALRIYANHELENIQKILRDIPKILQAGGRVAIISFHSLEDELVKNAFHEYARDGVLEILTKKPVLATAKEVHSNPRSRSAKLRAARLVS